MVSRKCIKTLSLNSQSSVVLAELHNIAKYLARVLGPLLVGRTEHHILNSRDFAEKVKDLHINADETITSFDVTVLFTSIPPADVIHAVRDVLTTDKHPQTLLWWKVLPP